ncbi:hypothetical protein [Alicyclobacillus sp. ALC3]|uniref:hypothetical protein n=1 Tax=Alicyclobacillus sp. ALC3 TaxID=2796143 RepID=UPI00237827B6|nr:hypothetical protein [Alicyclobacillus sp. ALC3]WDL98044.1 hypothetical protein JC200_04890 [Alicyclobacillus sp. ALC3]
MTGAQMLMLLVLLVVAVACTILRRRAVRWLFTTLAVGFWIAFLILLGFSLGYHVGISGIHVTHILF